MNMNIEVKKKKRVVRSTLQTPFAENILVCVF